MRLIEHASKWGNLYRRRWYVDGRRVSRDAFDVALDRLRQNSAVEPRTEKGWTFFRIIWET